MFGRCRPEAQMNLRRSSCDAQNATTHSENTHKHCAFRGEILSAVLKLRERGYSEAYLRLLLCFFLSFFQNLFSLNSLRLLFIQASSEESAFTNDE
jgi:hypothetical protein